MAGDQVDEKTKAEGYRKLKRDMKNDAWMATADPQKSGRGPVSINQETRALAHDALVPRKSESARDQMDGAQLDNAERMRRRYGQEKDDE